MNRILVITNEPSDLSRLLEEQFGAVILSNDADGFDADTFDSLCILGGNQEGSLILSCPLRLCVEKMREQNKPVFCEFLCSIGGIWQSESGGYARGVCPTTHHRMVFCKESLSGCDLADGAVLDGHMNECIYYSQRNTALTPILVYHDYVCAHDQIDMPKEELLRGLWTLWKLDENTLVAAFRLCNFRKARLAPAGHWQAVINAILSFLAGEKVRAEFAPPVCRYRESRVACAADTDGAAQCAL